MPEAPCSERQQSSGLGSYKNFKSPKELTANQKEKKKYKIPQKCQTHDSFTCRKLVCRMELHLLHKQRPE